SRRRHTRSKRDWSSDVCSSDLCTVSPPKSAQNTAPSWRWNPLASAAFPYKQLLSTVPAGTLSALLTLGRPVGTPAAPGAVAAARSEERRVGKECRSRGAPTADR